MTSLQSCQLMKVLVMVVCVILSQTEATPLTPSSLHQLGPCTCQVDDKIVDLTPLGNKNHTARFADMDNMYPFKFSWNPCENFNEGRCRGVAGCQVVIYPHQYFSLGSQTSAQFLLNEDGTLQISYQSKPIRGIKRKLYVTLLCVSPEEGDKVTVIGERRRERGVYDMSLYSQHACLRQLDSAGAAALSVGSILLISVACLLFVYLLSGALFQRFARKAKGLEILPHVVLWSALPGLIKDGCLFVKKRGKADQMYQPVG